MKCFASRFIDPDFTHEVFNWLKYNLLIEQWHFRKQPGGTGDHGYANADLRADHALITSKLDVTPRI